MTNLNPISQWMMIETRTPSEEHQRGLLDQRITILTLTAMQGMVPATPCGRTTITTKGDTSRLFNPISIILQIVVVMVTTPTPTPMQLSLVQRVITATLLRTPTVLTSINTPHHVIMRNSINFSEGVIIMISTDQLCRDHQIPHSGISIKVRLFHVLWLHQTRETPSAQSGNILNPHK